MKNNKDITLPLQQRGAQLEVDSTDENLVNVIWTTGAAVRRYSYQNREYYDEVLAVDESAIRLDRINQGAAPVLNVHSSWTLDDVIGIVVPGSVTIKDGVGRATLRLDDGPETESIRRKIKSGILRNVSVGYQVNSYQITRTEGATPIYLALDWEPYEISFVPIGADAGAGVRNAPTEHPCTLIETRTMENDMPAAVQEQTTTTTQTPNATVTTEQRANPAAAPAAAVTTIDQAAIRAEAVQAERARTNEITTIVRTAKLPDTFAEPLINNGSTVDAARKAVLDELARLSGEGGEVRTHTRVQVLTDETETRAAAVENALLHRFDPGAYQLDDAARQYRGLSLIEMGRDWLEKRGIQHRGLSRGEVAQSILTVRGAHMTTGDFTYILANVANKTLRRAYEAAPQTFRQISRQANASDFKTISRVQLGDAPALEKVNESGEFKRGKIGQAKEEYALATYGKVVGITRQTIINDDLDAFTRLPQMFGRAAADLESATVWGLITANAAMADGTALFHADHGNLAGSGGAIAVGTIGAGRKAMRTQKGINGARINITPKFIIVPAALESLAEQYTSNQYVSAKSSDINPYAGKLTPVVEPILDDTSITNWYLAADPAQIDTLEYAYLEGQEGVYLESRIGYDVDGIELKARLDFAAKAIDHRGLYKNAGQ